MKEIEGRLPLHTTKDDPNNFRIGGTSVELMKVVNLILQDKSNTEIIELFPKLTDEQIDVVRSKMETGGVTKKLVVEQFNQLDHPTGLGYRDPSTEEKSQWRIVKEERADGETWYAVQRLMYDFWMHMGYQRTFKEAKSRLAHEKMLATHTPKETVVHEE